MENGLESRLNKIKTDFAKMCRTVESMLAAANELLKNPDKTAAKDIVNTDKLVDEAEIIISGGGRIEDVSVSHRVYGRIAAHLGLTTVTHAEELYRSLKSGASKPLMSVTDGYHYHTVCAESEQKLDAIENALRAAGYLIEI